MKTLIFLGQVRNDLSLFDCLWNGWFLVNSRDIIRCMLMMRETFNAWMMGCIIIPKNQLIVFILEVIAIAQMCNPVFIIGNNCFVKLQQLIVLKPNPDPKIHADRSKDFLLIPLNIYTF